MTDKISFPPLLELPPGALEAQKQYLLNEVTRELTEPRLVRRLGYAGSTSNTARKATALRKSRLGAVAVVCAAAGAGVLLADAVRKRFRVTP
jgi:hypothetical protein